eukprot:CAMPEP_0170197576 /NCGR_PEP_ID=MMETSP0040_2-20121228/66687_1 /TAXON_ID=641309 /ORGANISM="Lotharella oceanica, Strain CCMP622" /LENGTH=65 /DNA_ID=CAMNT_0010447275 /DNA_START=1038 /DNA_END=1235 /DNA_ORIENTATION=-
MKHFFVLGLAADLKAGLGQSIADYVPQIIVADMKHLHSVMGKEFVMHAVVGEALVWHTVVGEAFV